MAGCGYRTCLVLLFVMLCLVYVADCRGGRGGGGRGGYRGGYRSGYRSYRYRGGSSGYYHSSGGGGGGNTAMIIGIVFGCIGGIVALVIIICCCAKVCGGNSSSDSSSTKYSRRGEIKSQPTQAYSASPAPFDPGNESYSTPQSKTQFNGNAAYNTYPVSPPSYDSAMADDRGSLPYSPNPTSDPSQPEPATAPPV